MAKNVMIPNASHRLAPRSTSDPCSLRGLATPELASSSYKSVCWVVERVISILLFELASFVSSSEVIRGKVIRAPRRKEKEFADKNKEIKNKIKCKDSGTTASRRCRESNFTVWI